MYFGVCIWGFLRGSRGDFLLICLLGVTRGEKQGSRLLSLNYDLMPKFPGQLPETKRIEKLVL